MTTLYVVRGLPGSGKTTLASKLVEDPKHTCAADDYFYQLGGGEYKFDPSKLGKAHKSCHEKVGNLMQLGVKDIAVHNTFSQKWEATPYIKLAEQHGYSVSILECQSKFENIHSVPQESITRMGERWEPLL